eukprot:NODE_14293_length_1117_cov_5.487879.p2 GENE.NODE_14293_length_1117_cov_5.487879~~NODE_14293_length_1117_cov_5.487879.p2  ORF type:complete len:119 (-),score=26.73 NODE_14293_length_1117_cov_5.487879:604-960(-)
MCDRALRPYVDAWRNTVAFIRAHARLGTKHGLRMVRDCWKAWMSQVEETEVRRQCAAAFRKLSVARLCRNVLQAWSVYAAVAAAAAATAAAAGRGRHAGPAAARDATARCAAAAILAS